ncbi:hypothetical protein EON82_04525 [bacterium]|nr:MAG: hypothetical protein EON82_04525 [bacterium]
MLLTRWTVDYGDGPHPVVLPHAWGQDISVEWEGPAVYRTEVDIPRGGGTVRFHGVSYAAEVFANGGPVARHEGIWDAFDVALPTGKVDLEVRVTKNGGPTYPVRDVASGFLPFVYHTFGGIFREVELIESDPLSPLGERGRGEGSLPYVRGLLHWGWYPELGHPNPDEETIRTEVRAAKELGFNLVKFCLWVPPHRYLDILEEEGMLGWLELPLWDPRPERLQAMADEIERIVLQYRHHPSIAIWTVGCELSTGIPHEFRREMVGMVQALTGCPWVKDNSGGAEMYGGDLREYGTFDDFHPYCDLPFYPPVLDSLCSGESTILLGEFNDHDVHRDLARIGNELPYWASSLPELNAQGVRWQHDLPSVLESSRFALEPTKNRHRALMESSRRKSLFIRKTVHEAVRARPEINGYAITGWRDTPISSSGFFDDWGGARFTPEECLAWNGEGCLFPIPTRRPPWVHGGNRPGWLDPFSYFAGDVFLRIGVSAPEEASLWWRIADAEGRTVARGSGEFSGGHGEVGQVVWEGATPGEYRLEAKFGTVENAWPLWVVERPQWPLLEGWSVHDPAGLIPELSELPGGDRLLAVRRAVEGAGGVLLLDEEGTLPMPFWRECIQEFKNPSLERWERMLPVSPDGALDPKWLLDRFGDYEVLMNRVDTRTYAEHPLLVRAGNWIVTTLRPQGGLGSQPPGLRHNPAGCALLRYLMQLNPRG